MSPIYSVLGLKICFWAETGHPSGDGGKNRSLDQSTATGVPMASGIGIKNAVITKCKKALPQHLLINVFLNFINSFTQFSTDRKDLELRKTGLKGLQVFGG